MIKPLPPQYRIFCDLAISATCWKLSHELFLGASGQKAAEEFLAKGTGGWKTLADGRHACPDCAGEMTKGESHESGA